MTRQRCHARGLKVKYEYLYRTFISLTYNILVTKKKPSNLSVPDNKKKSSSRPQATRLANTGTTGGKRKSEPQVTEQAPPPPKKKMKVTVDLSHPSATTAATKHDSYGAPSNCNNHGAPSDCDNHGALSNTTSVKKRRRTDDDAAHSAKKTKAVPIQRTGKIISQFLMLKCLLTECL